MPWPTHPYHRLLTVTALAGSLTAGCWWLWSGRTSMKTPILQPPSGAAVMRVPPKMLHPPVVLHELAGEYSQQIVAPNQSPQERLSAVMSLLDFYTQALGSTPCGHNELVVSALLGDNEKGAQMILNDCPAIRQGQLVDEWGEPYWFHTVSNREIDVRSAGPDRELFTSDDVTSNPSSGN